MQQSETDIEKQLKKLLAQYPQVVLFSSHTHFLTEHPRSFYQTGFTMVNTGSVGDPWYEGGEVKNRSESLFVYVYDNRIVIKGYDHENSRWVSQYTVSLPYTARAAKGSAPVFTSNDLQVDRWSQNAADVTFTSPVSAYGIDKYEVYVDGKLAATEYIRYWENAKPSESVTVRVGGLTKGQHTISVKAYDLYLTPSKSVEQSVQIGSE